MNNLGYNHLEYAQNGQETIYKVLTTDTYDLILMDLQMPIMDGIAATKEIRANKDNNINLTPIIAVTANVSSDDILKCKAANMNDFLSKPVVTSELEELLEKTLK